MKREIRQSSSSILGPLLQRASSVVLHIPNTKVPLTVTTSLELPSYSTGFTIYQKAGAFPTIDWTREFLPFVKESNREETISGDISGCDAGTCTAKLRAPALAAENCTTFYEYRNYTAPLSSHEMKLFKHSGDLPMSRNIHVVNAWVVNGSTEYLVLRTGLPDDEIVRTCTGYMVFTDCYYASGK